MSHLPHHLQQESLDLNNQLDAIKSKIIFLQKKVQEHQNANKPITISVTPSSPKLINSYAMIDNTEDNIKTTESPCETPISPLTVQSIEATLMKTIHWKPINFENISGSIWSQIDLNLSDFEPQQLEEQFRATSGNKTVHFLTPARRQQVKQGLASLHMSNEEIRDIILTLDETRINIERIRILVDIAPFSTEQLQAIELSKYKNIKYFGDEETFFYCLRDMKELRLRLKQWLFTLEFTEKFQKINETITIVEKAKLALCLSKELKQLLRIVLTFGNYMNCDNMYNQNCHGFEISDLYLLSTIETCDSDPIGFPMFLCQFLQKKHPELLGNIISQCRIVKTASELDCQKIDDEYFSLLQQTSDLESMVSEYKDKYFGSLNVNDQFVQKMNVFQKHLNNEMWKLKFRVDSYHKCHSHLIKYFAYDATFDGKPLKMEKIFKDIYGFIEILETAKNKLHRKSIENLMHLFPNENKFIDSKTTILSSGKIGEKSDPETEDDIISPKDSDVIDFKRNRRNTQTLKLELDVLELNKTKTGTQTPGSVIRHKSIEAKMNRFISQTPLISTSHPSPYKHAAKRIMQSKKQSTLRIRNEITTPASSPNDFEVRQKNQYAKTPASSKSYVNPYKMIANNIKSNYQTTNLTNVCIIEE